MGIPLADAALYCPILSSAICRCQRWVEEPSGMLDTMKRLAAVAAQYMDRSPETRIGVKEEVRYNSP